MPEVSVRVPGLLARFTDGRRAVLVRADTVEECLDRLVESHPSLEPHLRDGEGRLRDHIQVFVDDRNVEWFDDGVVTLDEGATVTILQAVSGG